MSILNTLTHGLIYKDGESSLSRHGGSWWKYGNYWIAIRLVVLPTYIKLLPIWLLSLMGHRWSMKILGGALGYGFCSNCGMPWKYAKGKVIHFAEGRGMFPLCEQCFDSLSPQRIDMYIDQLINTWLDDCRRFRLEWKPPPPVDIAEAAKAEVRRMKLTV